MTDEGLFDPSMQKFHLKGAQSAHGVQGVLEVEVARLFSHGSKIWAKVFLASCSGLLQVPRSSMIHSVDDLGPNLVVLAAAVEVNRPGRHMMIGGYEKHKIIEENTRLIEVR